MLPEPGPQHLKHVGVFRKTLGQNIARTVKRRLGVGHTFIGRNKGLRFGLRIKPGVLPELIGKRLKAGRDGSLRTRLTLGLVGEVKVFQTLLGVGCLKGLPQFFRHLALLLNRSNHGGTALFKLTSVNEKFLQVSELCIIKSARDFLTVTGDKRNRCTFIEQRHRSAYLRRAGTDRFGNMTGNAGLSRQINFCHAE